MPERPILTTLICRDVEKGDDYFRHYLASLRCLNSWDHGKTQWIVLTQHRKDDALFEMLQRSPVPMQVVHTCTEFVDGYPVWDILSAVRQVESLVAGTWVHFAHPEYIWGIDCIHKVLDWLEKVRPIIALGNLTRTGTIDELKTGDVRGIKAHSDRLAQALEWREPMAFQEAVESVPLSRWIYWTGPQDESGRAAEKHWMEDSFFASWDWIQAIRFAHHGGEAPFQDVYDIMGAVHKQLRCRNIMPPVERMPDAVCREYHLHHENTFASFSPAMRDWFLSDPKRWAETIWLEEPLWEMFEQQKADPGAKMAYNPRYLCREGPGGTQSRYNAAMSIWLHTGGIEDVRNFHALHGDSRLLR